MPFIRHADEDAATKAEGHGLQIPGNGPRTVLVEHHPPHKLQSLFGLSLPEQGRGREGLLEALQNLLKYSVNTWDQGFLDKLYASPNAVGVASELILATLNTNVHVYQVSPALTIVEKQTSRALASLFGFTGPHAGGISQPGGSAANQSSIVIARNHLYPETKSEGIGNKRFVLFTSAHGHYSLEKAAQMFGFGSGAVRSVPVDEKGQMEPKALEVAIQKAKQEGKTPFYVNATAGTTVLGSYDPLESIADLCKMYKLWMHVDGSWGGPAIFSEKQKHKLKGSGRADSIAICPHKMLGVSITCSFLLGKDLRQFHQAMTLPAGYLFHNSDDGDDHADNSAANTSTSEAHAILEHEAKEVWDLADLTPQCGRKGDSLKLALGWIYYGHSGYAAMIDGAFDTAAYLAELVSSNPKFSLVSEDPPPCLQVCFYFDKQTGAGHQSKNSKTTAEIARLLVPRGFMIDYAPGEEGKFFRVVVNCQTRRGTVEGLVKAIDDVGDKLAR